MVLDMIEEKQTSMDQIDSGSIAPISTFAQFSIGMSVQHKKFGFRGVIFDVDPTFSNTDEWWDSIPEEIRPAKNQPFYHLFAVSEEEDNPYVAYVSEQNLIPDTSDLEIAHPAIPEFFDGMKGDCFKLRQKLN